MPVVYEFRFSEDFLIETWRRYRRHKRHRTFGVIRLVTVVIAGLFGVLFIVLGLWWLALFFALLIVGAYQGHRIDEWLTRRRFRKSPYHDDPVRIEISDDGFWIRGSKGEARLQWAAFTRTVRFPDGWLCLQGPGVANWLPDSALRPDESTERLDDLVQRELPTSAPATARRAPAAGRGGRAGGRASGEPRRGRGRR